MKNYHLKALQHQIESWEVAAIRSGYSGVSGWVRDTLESVSVGLVKPEFTEEQMVRGRDPNREEIAEDFQFRIDPEAVKHWKEAAACAGLGIQEWCRQSLDYAAADIQ